MAHQEPISKITQICSGLHRWYRHCGKGSEYNNKFSSFCEENGYDEESIDEELKVDNVDENQFMDCFDDLDQFPFADPIPSTDDDKKRFILDLIVQLSSNPDADFRVNMPKFNKVLFENVGKEQLERTKREYEEHTKALWDQGMANDNTLLQVLAIGRAHRFDYLLHLTDDYSRKRVEHFKKHGGAKTLEEAQWVDLKQHGHFEKLKNLKVTVPAAGDGSQSVPILYKDLAKGAVQGFFKRIMPKLLFAPMSKINGSLKMTVQYMAAAMEWITNLLTTASGQGGVVSLCPFQFDLCFAVGEPKRSDHDISVLDEDEDDDDDDDHKDDDIKYIDYIGDIGAKLTKNKMKHLMMEKNAKDKVGRVFEEMYIQFLEGNGLKKIDDLGQRSYLQRKRLISFVDRRGQSGGFDQSLNDQIFMFEPPEDARDIPEDAVPEWFVSSSRTSLLPDLKYDPKKGGLEDDGKEDDPDPDDDEATKHPDKFKNIGVLFPCSSALLTLSFHVKQENVVKAYLYHNGQSIRFMPEDIRDVLPTLFNMEWGDNAKWIKKEKDVQHYVDVMAKCLVDVEFKAFQQSYTN